MDILTLALIGGGLLLATKKKTTDSGDEFTTLTPPNVEKPKPGEPKLTIDKIRKLLNRVDFTFTDGNLTENFEKKWKEELPIIRKVGKFTVIAKTEKQAVPGRKEGSMQWEWGPIMITVQDQNGTVKYAKRVFVNEGRVIDIK